MCLVLHVRLVLCLMKEYFVSIVIESLSRVEDSIYLSPLSELAKKRQQELNDVPVESGVFRIEGPAQFVADPSR